MMLAVLLAGPAVDFAGIVGAVAAFALLACCYWIAGRVPEGWATRAVIGLALVLALCVAVGTVVEAAYYYDLKAYCSSVWGWVDPVCW